MNLLGMRMFEDHDEVDVVVIGTGAGGGPVLAELAAAGWSAVALEAGESRDPRGHTADEIDAAPLINWVDERLSGGETPTAFGANNSGRGVGGSTLHWGAFTPRPDEGDLAVHRTTGAGVDWPFGVETLLPYLLRAERDLGVSGPAEYPWDPSRTYDMPPTARNASSDMMLRGCEALGIRATDAPAAVLTRDRHQDHVGMRYACVSCGSCHQGCRNGAKGGTDVSYLPAALASGAEIRTGSTATGFETDASGRITAVLYVRRGIERRQRCRRVLLAGGGVETPRLLLHAGLANSSGQVGRNFMAHGGVQVWGRFDTPMRGYRGYPSSIISEDFRRPADADFASGYLIQSLGVQPLTMGQNIVRGSDLIGADLVRALLEYPMVAGVGINGECLPSERNLLELADETDELGVPKARVLFTQGENEQAIDAHAVRVMTGIVEAAGGTDIRVVPRTAHTLGTCRMGDDPDTSVVDADGRSHDVPNLWVCDNSVFPSSVLANPLLATVALGLRTAERMKMAA